MPTLKKILHQSAREYHEFKKLHAHHLKSELTQSEAATWDHLIRSYCTQHPTSKLPFLVYKQMQSKGINPTRFTLPTLLKSLTTAASLQEGLQIHGVALKSSFLDDNIYVVHTLVSLYSRCSMVEASRRLFDEMPVRNCVSWNVMISSYCQNGFFEEALNLFYKMREGDYSCDKVTLVSVLPACAHLGAVGLGQWVHREAKREGQFCVFIGTALIDMYCKCGFVDEAWDVFNEMSDKNIVTWNAMIGGFAMHGYSTRAFELFDELILSSVRPSFVTFICVLCACTHAGVVEKGWWYFNLMKEKFSVDPTIQHYTCMVDLLGRAGCLTEALELIESMPYMPDAVIWGSLIGACRMHKNVALGERVMKHLVELEPRNSGNYMILSNMYADMGQWDDAFKTAMKMKYRGIKKMPGCSWIEVDSKVYRFFSGDSSHPFSEDIYDRLKELQRQLSLAGYIPNTGSVLRNLEEEDKEDAIRIHSEKLAMAFGLIRLSHNAIIRVVKNLRMCIDCHSFVKHASRIVGRKIIIRDNSRFHHFREGSCSCKDYW